MKSGKRVLTSTLSEFSIIICLSFSSINLALLTENEDRLLIPLAHCHNIPLVAQS